MKRFVALIVCVSMVFTLSLAGCGKKAEDVSAGDTDNTVQSGDVKDDPEKSEENSQEWVTLDGKSAGDVGDVMLTLVTHPLTCKSDDGKVLATGTHPEIILSENARKSYPKLVDAVAELNETWSTETRSAVSEFGYYRDEDNFSGDAPYTSETTAEILRFDDHLMSMRMKYYDFSGGVHPMHAVGSVNLDPVTGKEIMLRDVLADTKGTPEIIKEELYSQYPEITDEFESFSYTGDEEKSGFVEVLEGKLDEDSFTWFLLPDGLGITFSPYEIASYAAGYIDIVLPYKDYPDLVQKAYIPEGEQDMGKIVKTEEAQSENLPAEPSDYYEGEGEGEGLYVEISNPSWDEFYLTAYEDPNAKHIKLKKLTDEKSDWLDTEVWANDNGFEVAHLPYSDGTYYYEATDPIEYDYMFSNLVVYDADAQNVLYDFNLYTLMNGPDDDKGKYSATTQYIRWAQIVDDILYVSVGHNGYASVESQSSYIVAIDINTNDVIWRSDPLVSNANNFKIVGDTIICGYGFTAEDDYIYLLDLSTGQTVERIKVRSGPDQFEVVGDTLYVATYNTAYTFKIEQ